MPEIEPTPRTVVIQSQPEQAKGLGPRELIHWITVDNVDRSREVLVASGGDFSEYARNPVVLFNHSANKDNPHRNVEGDFALPVGVCKWWRVANHPGGGQGVMVRSAFDDDPFALRVCSKYKSESPSLTSWSLTFQPYKGTYGPPTAEEIRRRPDWAGAKMVYRKWKLLEYSAVVLPDNPQCTTITKSIMGDRPRGKAMPDDEHTDATGPETESVQAVEAAPEPAPEPEPEPTPTPEPAPESEPEPVAKAMTGAEAADADEDDEDSDAPIRQGHFVRAVKGEHKGAVGKVKSIHRSGMVPDVEGDVACSKSAPGARVQCYKSMGEGHAETAHHVGARLSELERTDDLKPPRKRKPAPAPVEKGWGPAERAVYKAALMSGPAFERTLEARIAERFEVKILGKV